MSESNWVSVVTGALAAIVALANYFKTRSVERSVRVIQVEVNGRLSSVIAHNRELQDERVQTALESEPPKPERTDDAGNS